MQVIVKDNNVEKALRIFKKKTMALLKEVRDRQFYKKPSIRKREARIAISEKRKDEV